MALFRRRPVPLRLLRQLGRDLTRAADALERLADAAEQDRVRQGVQGGQGLAGWLPVEARRLAHEDRSEVSYVDDSDMAKLEELRARFLGIRGREPDAEELMAMWSERGH